MNEKGGKMRLSEKQIMDIGLILIEYKTGKVTFVDALRKLEHYEII